MDHHKDKVGSDPEQAGQMVGEKDFGAKESDVRQRNYVSGETRRHDPGKSVAHSGDNLRTSGVGGNDSGRGSSSGGDMDAGEDALIGFGDPNLHPPHQKPTAARPGEVPVLDPPVIDPDPVPGGDRDNASSTSAADVNNETARGPDDDSFKGDITPDEATGQSGQ